MAEERQRLRSVTTIVACVFGVFVLYFLSAGPFIRLYSRSPPPQFLIQLYAPLNWLYENTVMRRPMDWYAGLWVPDPHEPSN